MAVEGPVIEWVGHPPQASPLLGPARRPAQPHLDHAPGWRGTLRGLGHAHVGWMFRGKDMANPPATPRTCSPTATCASSAAPSRSGCRRTGLPFGLGVALTGSLAAGSPGLLWGGAVRIFLLHHATFSINSLCHYFGRRRSPPAIESRNLAWLAPLAFGEAWQQQPPRLPDLSPARTRPAAGRSQRVAHRRPGALPLAWDVVQISPERQELKRGSAAA
jgi:stearoyl-CoA desaturase (delta-9 desaturase)